MIPVLPKINCRHCHGRGKLEFSFPKNDKLGLMQTVGWLRDCYCIENAKKRQKWEEHIDD